MGVGWCQVSFSTQSEPLGYVLCLGLEQNGVAPNHLVHSEAVAAESPATSASSKLTPAAVADSTALTNKDILDMNKIGLPPQILVAKIKSSQTDFNTSPAQLKELKAEGLPDAVILDEWRKEKKQQGQAQCSSHNLKTPSCGHRNR
jgi:hypothetical protein